MSHLNYFEPYQSKPGHHEDQLTRAFLVVLKYSPAAFMRFYSYCVDEIRKLANSEGKTVMMSSIHELPFKNTSFDTQISSYSFNSARIISVLITDNSNRIGGVATPVEFSERNARYDGVIEIGDDITLLIENKPNAKNVWRNQLNPSFHNLPTESSEDTLIPFPAILEWREIIQQLNDLIAIESVSGMEKLLIDDFLEFVDRRFAGLNPYQHFGQCKDNKYLITQRIKSILETGFQSNKPGYHRGWAHYIIAESPEVKQIGVRLDYTDNEPSNWQIEISLYFGDIMQQGRDMYRRTDLDLGYIQILRDKGWKTLLNPHISMHSKNWFFFNWPENDNVESYFKYWQENTSELKQYKKSELREKLPEWSQLGLIQFNEAVQQDYENKLRNVQEGTKFNWCPGFRILYFIPAKEAIQLDEARKFELFLREKFNEGLRFLGEDKGSMF